ncbi:MAG TPA: hypothetical protein V6D11_26825 [Waterburya sp.]|jgi:hypothetical protein
MFKSIITASTVALTALTLSSLPIYAQNETSPGSTPESTPSSAPESTPSSTPESTPSSTPSSTQRTLDNTDAIAFFRAQNLARQAAEKANGGLGNYRAESSMYGPAPKAPYVDNGNGTWTFTFKGHRPGSDVDTYESVVTVSREGNVTIDYNGAVRSGTSTPSTTPSTP